MKNDMDFKIKNNLATVKPFVYNEPSISVLSIRMLVLLLIQFLALCLTKSFMAIQVIFFSTLGAFLAGLLCHLITKKQPYHIISLIVQGILLGMLLPETFPFASVFTISFCILFVLSLFVCKNVSTWVNVVAFCIYICYNN